MTFSSWGDVPAGMPAHHHCVVSIERAHDPKHWTDPSKAEPDLVAWQYPDAVAWVHAQLAAHRDEAAGDLQSVIDERLDSYVPAQIGPDVDHHRYRNGAASYCPSTWERLPQTLQTGGWVAEAFQLGTGRKLVLQILGYADSGQRASATGVGRPYAVCGQHQRPTESPYLGLTRGQADHFQLYSTP